MQVTPLGRALKNAFSRSGLLCNEARRAEVLASAGVVGRCSACAAGRGAGSFAVEAAAAGIAGSRVSTASAPNPAVRSDLGRWAVRNVEITAE